ncbi:unnamed protein product, partial [Protopolystoma xenopodis]
MQVFYIKALPFRPLNKYEESKGSTTAVHCTNDGKVVISDRSGTKTYCFDRVFGTFSKQNEVYKSILAPLVEEMLQGYNCTIFAYGQTGSGKTYTMTGERSDTLRYGWETDPVAGLVPRALSHIFNSLESIVSLLSHIFCQPNGDASVRVSFLELYNEELFDLLSSDDIPSKLSLFDDTSRKGSLIIKGLREVVVLHKEDVYGILERGLAKRQTASTNLN